MKAINDYRDASREAIKEMIKLKPHTGAWSPACVQHGFTDSLSFNDPHYNIPGSKGKGIPETIQAFLNDPLNPPIVMDTVNWPDN